jgi:hypothetical protein
VEISVWVLVAVILASPSNPGGAVSTIVVDNLASKSECIVLAGKLQTKHSTKTTDCYEVKKIK